MMDCTKVALHSFHPQQGFHILPHFTSISMYIRLGKPKQISNNNKFFLRRFINYRILYNFYISFWTMTASVLSFISPFSWINSVFHTSPLYFRGKHFSFHLHLFRILGGMSFLSRWSSKILTMVSYISKYREKGV